MEIIYNDLEKSKYRQLAQCVLKLIGIHIFLILVLSIPLIIGILLLTIWQKTVLGIFIIIIGAILSIIGIMSSLYAIKLYFKTKKEDYSVKRIHLLGDNIEKYESPVGKIEIENKEIMFLNFYGEKYYDNTLIDVIYDKNGKVMFAIPQINCGTTNTEKKDDENIQIDSE